MKKNLIFSILMMFAVSYSFSQREDLLLPEDASISPDSVVYWVGEGPNEVILVVNWCDPELALAWGYRFNQDSILVSELVAQVDSADARLVFTHGSWGIDEITYEDDIYTLSLSGNWWMYNVNGLTALVGYTQQYVKHGDIVKFGDESCGETDESFNYTWTTPIMPVMLPQTVGVLFPSSAMESSLFPNPAGAYTLLSISNIVGWVDLSLFDLSGKKVWSESLMACGAMQKVISTDWLPRGCYLLTVNHAGRKTSYKLNLH